MSTTSNQIKEPVQRVSSGENKNARYLFLSEIIDKKVQTRSGIIIGKLRDLIFKDDPNYAEVTSLIVERPLGRPPWKISWANVVDVTSQRTVVEDPPGGKYPEIKHGENNLVLRDKVLDKRILDIEGFDVEVVYDMQLLLVEHRLLVVGADVGRQAFFHRLGLGRIARLFLNSAS